MTAYSPVVFFFYAIFFPWLKEQKRCPQLLDFYQLPYAAVHECDMLCRHFVNLLRDKSASAMKHLKLS